MINRTASTVTLKKLTDDQIHEVLSKDFMNVNDRRGVRIILGDCDKYTFEHNITRLFFERDDYSMGHFAFAYAVEALIKAHTAAMDELVDDEVCGDGCRCVASPNCTTDG